MRVKSWHRSMVMIILVMLVVAIFSGCGNQGKNKSDGQGTDNKSAKTEEKVIKVAALLPLTGAQAGEGENYKNGLELWRILVNEKGGIRAGGESYKINITYYDYASNTDTAIKLTEKIITQDGIKYLFGPYGSMVVEAVAPVVEKYEAIQLSEAAASSIFEKGRKWTFSLLPPSAVAAKGWLDGVLNVKGDKPKTLAILARNDLYPLDLAKALKSLAEERGLDVVFFETYPPDATDLTSPLTQIKTKNPDMVFISGYLQDHITAIQQGYQLGLKPKVWGGKAGVDNPRLREALGDIAMGITSGEPWLPNGPDKNKDDIFGTAQEYAKKFEEKFGYEPAYAAAAQSAEGLVLQRAVEAVGSIDDVKAVREAIAKLNISSFYGPIRFNAGGQIESDFYGAFQIQESGLVIIAPGYETGEFIYPLQWK